MTKTTENYYDFCKRNAREQLISYAQGSLTEIPEQLRGAFSLLFDASNCNSNLKHEEVNKMGRVIVARGVVIDTIHALSHAQVQRAEAAAMQLAEEPSKISKLEFSIMTRLVAGGKKPQNNG